MQVSFFNILIYGEVGNCHVLGMKFDMSTIVLKISYISGDICRYMANSIAEVTLPWCQSSFSDQMLTWKALWTQAH